MSTHLPFLHHESTFEPSERLERTLFGTFTLVFLCILILFFIADFNLAVLLSIPVVIGAGSFLISEVLRE